MPWFYVLVGGVMDVGWAIGLKLSQGFSNPLLSIATIICILISYGCYVKSIRMLPAGTAYAVFTGVGGAGTVIAGMLFLNEPADWMRIGFISFMFFGILGLKKHGSQRTPCKPNNDPLSGGIIKLDWICLIVAGLLEVVSVVLMKRLHGFRLNKTTLICIATLGAVSFYFHYLLLPFRSAPLMPYGRV